MCVCVIQKYFAVYNTGTSGCLTRFHLFNYFPFFPRLTGRHLFSVVTAEWLTLHWAAHLSVPSVSLCTVSLAKQECRSGITSLLFLNNWTWVKQKRSWHAMIMIYLNMISLFRLLFQQLKCLTDYLLDCHELLHWHSLFPEDESRLDWTSWLPRECHLDIWHWWLSVSSLDRNVFKHSSSPQDTFYSSSSATIRSTFYFFGFRLWPYTSKLITFPWVSAVLDVSCQSANDRTLQ